MPDRYDDPMDDQSMMDHSDEVDLEEQNAGIVVDDSSLSDIYSHASVRRKAGLAPMAKGQHRIYRRVRNTRVPIVVFTTRTTPGARIRNAVTGIYEPQAFVGKADEFEFFKVALATGELGKDAPSTTLFFDSQSQYERHMKVGM